MISLQRMAQKNNFALPLPWTKKKQNLCSTKALSTQAWTLRHVALRYTTLQSKLRYTVKGLNPGVTIHLRYVT